MKLPRRGILKGLLASPVAVAATTIPVPPGLSSGSINTEVGYTPIFSGPEKPYPTSSIERIVQYRGYKKNALQNLQLRKKHGLTSYQVNPFESPPEHSIYRSFKSIAPWKVKEMYDKNNMRRVELRMENELLDLEKIIDFPENLIDILMSQGLF